MTVVGQRSGNSGRPAAEPTLSGPVLGCIEDGRGGLAAARIAGSLARWLGADLHLATVQQAHPQTRAGGDLTPAAVRHGRLLHRAARQLDQAAAIRVAIGEPAEKLLALADSEGAELLVVPATSQSRTGTLLLGSVYLALSVTAPCPVVVVAPGVETIATTGPIVCGVDGSAASLTAARVAADLAERLETRLLLVHAANALPITAPGLTGGCDTAWGTRQYDSLTMLQGIANGLPTTVPPLLRVEHGLAAERLAHVARAQSAQMIVTGSRGRGRIASVLLGSVASELARTVDRPLMIVPPDVRRLGRGERGALAVRRLRSGGAVLSVPGDVDSVVASRLERTSARLLAATGGRLVIDLSESDAIDVEAIHLLERLAGRANELDGALVLVVTSTAVRRRLDRLAPPWAIVTDDLDAALDTIAARSHAES